MLKVEYHLNVAIQNMQVIMHAGAADMIMLCRGFKYKYWKYHFMPDYL